MVRNFLIILFLLQSCIAITHDKDKLFIRNSLINQETPLKKDGFYYTEELETRDDGIKHISAFIFYNEGYLLNLGSYNGVSDTYCSIKKYYDDNSYMTAKSKLISYLEYLKSDNKIYSSCKIKSNDISSKGLYKISNDSIILQYYQAEPQNEKYDSFNSYYLYELRGIIINSEEFIIKEKIDYRRNRKEKKKSLYRYEYNEDTPIR